MSAAKRVPVSRVKPPKIIGIRCKSCGASLEFSTLDDNRRRVSDNVLSMWLADLGRERDRHLESCEGPVVRTDR